MFETAFNWLLDHYPFIGGLILFTIFVVWVTIKVIAFISKVKKTEDKVNHLPCDHHKENITGITGQVSFMQDIKESIRKIEEYILRNDNAAIDMLVRKCSPYKITTYGEELMTLSGARKCIDDNVDYFIRLIEEREPKVALDVEQYALSVLNENTKHEMFNDIKNYVFNSPASVTVKVNDGPPMDITIKIESILMVMSIYLRDKYFQKHPEIDITHFFKQKPLE